MGYIKEIVVTKLCYHTDSLWYKSKCHPSRVKCGLAQLNANPYSMYKNK